MGSFSCSVQFCLNGKPIYKATKCHLLPEVTVPRSRLSQFLTSTHLARVGISLHLNGPGVQISLRSYGCQQVTRGLLADVFSRGWLCDFCSYTGLSNIIRAKRLFYWIPTIDPEYVYQNRQKSCHPLSSRNCWGLTLSLWLDISCACPITSRDITVDDFVFRCHRE